MRAYCSTLALLLFTSLIVLTQTQKLPAWVVNPPKPVVRDVPQTEQTIEIKEIPGVRILIPEAVSKMTSHYRPKHVPDECCFEDFQVCHLAM